MTHEDDVRAERTAASVLNKRMLAGAMVVLGTLVSYGINSIRGDNSEMKQTLKDVSDNQQKMQLDSASIKSDVRNLYTRLDDEVIKQMQSQALTIQANKSERMQQIEELRARIQAIEEVQSGHRMLR